jgi:hypothetical protein
MIELEDDEDVFPWAVKFDDLEIFVLTMISMKRGPKSLANFLSFREKLHGKLICMDELEICGGYLRKEFDIRVIDNSTEVSTKPEYCDIFDEQYQKGMGFRNEKLLMEKKSGRYLFW